MRAASFLLWMVAGACVALTQPAVCANESTTPKGVVLVVIDDIGYGDLDALYPSDLETPSLDSLCQQSVRLTDFHVGTTCSPSRAAMMTGRSVNAGGVWHTIAGREILRENEQTVAEVFQANGWQTGIFGKWHLGEGYPFSPRFRGFDVSVIHGGGGVGQGPDYWRNDYYSGVDFNGESTRADVYFKNGKQITADTFCTDYWFGQAKEFIASCASEGRPFFCYVPTNAAHGPFNAPNGFKMGFDGLIENIDDNIAKLDEFLVNLGIKDDVLFIFTTDNGTAGKRLGGLRGIKGSHYDGGHNVPCFLRWKNGAIAGTKDSARDVESLTANMDFLPTFIDLFELNRPEGGKPLHGKSIKELLLNPNHTPQTRTLVVDTQRGAKLRKWHRACVIRDEIEDGKIVHKWRLSRKSKSNEAEVYDFLVDRDTDDNIATENLAVVDELSKAYESWWTEISPGQQEYSAFVVNPEKQFELTLHAHCWIGRNNSPWHQFHIRNAVKGTGVHAIRFDKPGQYRFELRRWPREDGGPIAAQSNSGEGELVPAIKARLSIDGVGEKTKTIEAGASSVVFVLEINKSESTKIHTEFLDENNKTITGAYYVYIRQADGS